MSVRKLPNGKWVADVTLGKRLDGSRDRRQPEFKTKKEAEKEERRLLMLKESGRGKSYGGILFSDFVTDYFWPQKTYLRGTTIKGYKRDLKLRLLPAFGDMAIEDIGRYEIQRMINSCATKKVATNARGTLSSILRLALEMDIIAVNPASFSYQYPKASDSNPELMGVWLSTFKEIKQVLDFLERNHANEPVHRICVLGLCMGLRKGEIIAAHADNVHLRQYYLYINETCTEGDDGVVFTDPKTPRAFRPVPIVSLAYKWLEAWSKEGGYIVHDEKGNPLTPRATRYAVGKVFDREKFEDGSPLPRITPFSLRHSFATSCVNAGIEVTKLSKWMGHRDIATTQKYYVKQKLKDLRSDAALIDDSI